MSREGAQAFVERLNDDETFRDGLVSAGDNETRLRMVRDAGFDVTEDDLEELRREHGAHELSEEDLQRIAGGATTTEVVSVVGTAISFVGFVAGLV